ncbi:hypothetical protein OIU77_002469 [Salix suchowensis]|uniref:Uncharacterized protein n=1 Tax=Salix suchowensis TaxID=1278906 RepID=A0ABQ9AWF5_9ROSI|nr:hypothetical protein OIU77_002469 [Salix suchowensis]
MVFFISCIKAFRELSFIGKEQLKHLHGIYKFPCWCLIAVFLLLMILVMMRVNQMIVQAGSVEETCSESEVEDDNDAVNEEEWTSSAEAKSDCSDDDAVDLEANAEAALKKLLPCSLEEFEKRVPGECESSSKSMKNESAGTSETSKRPLHKGNFFQLALHCAFFSIL